MQIWQWSFAKRPIKPIPIRRNRRQFFSAFSKGQRSFWDPSHQDPTFKKIPGLVKASHVVVLVDHVGHGVGDQVSVSDLHGHRIGGQDFKFGPNRPKGRGLAALRSQTSLDLTLLAHGEGRGGLVHARIQKRNTRSCRY